ncbi:MAG TPA: 3'-5' exonuclease [Nocardioides sp.]|uniref:3'-5' exonuclease n=1 Tax=Nocardioides sp. TaxID=35761 RepID=UPI002B6C6D5F|nr:3'-5' exonuclease [Nocardioides sp.]HQR28167.1 3'-5' exonuclease [Nocardioides sp.]
MDRAAPLRARLARARPWPCPADGLGWREAELAVIDVETTGLDLRRDEVISIGVVPVRHGRIAADRWYQVVRPERAIDPEAVKVHALTPGELEAAPPLAGVLPEVRARLRGRVVVAHAAWVERAFLDRALAPSRERLPKELVDTAALARAAGVRRLATHEPDLELLARDLDLPVHTPHHALGDALTTAQVLLVLATRLEAAAGDSADRDPGEPALTVRDLLRLTRRHSR